MRACVTGATGCVGRNLVDELLKDSWDVLVLHRPSSDLSKLDGCDVSFAEVDLLNPHSVQSAIPAGVDAVFHVAADISHWSRHKEQQWSYNVIGTRNLLETAKNKGVKRFIFTSTGAVARAGIKTSIHSGYIHSKKDSEAEVLKAVKQGLDAVIVRPPIVIGKYDYNNYSTIFSTLKNSTLAAFPGHLIFAHAEDIARGHIQAFDKGEKGEIFWLGGEFTTWQDVFERIGRLVGRKPLPVLPTFLWYGLAYVADTVSKLTGKEPLVTPELIFLVNGAPKDPDIVGFLEGRKAAEKIGYQSRSLDEALKDCYAWMSAEGRL